MIPVIDQALAALLRRASMLTADIDVVFDAPTKDWAAARSAPTVNVYLHDLREDTERRSYGQVDVRGDDGRVVSRQAAPRYVLLSYLLTAWTARAQDEHQLLAVMLDTVLEAATLPPELLPDQVRAAGPISLTLSPSGPVGPDLWSALGGTLKPSLDLRIRAPFLPAPKSAGPPVSEPALVSLRELP